MHHSAHNHAPLRPQPCTTPPTTMHHSAHNPPPLAPDSAYRCQLSLVWNQRAWPLSSVSCRWFTVATDNFFQWPTITQCVATLTRSHAAAAQRIPPSQPPPLWAEWHGPLYSTVRTLAQFMRCLQAALARSVCSDVLCDMR
jgi:hypothetical protein